MLTIGDMLPDVAFRDGDGKEVRASEIAGGKALVLYFYPKDDTMVCTVQATTFRDEHRAFEEAGAKVVGVSGDDAVSHEAFSQKHDLPFPLLSDPDGSARRAFGVKKTLGLLPGRVTFVADREGRIRKVISSQLRAKVHVEEALEAVRALAAQ